MIEINCINSQNFFVSQCEVSQSGYLLGLDRRYECDYTVGYVTLRLLHKWFIFKMI